MEPENHQYDYEYPSGWWDSQPDRKLASAAEELEEEIDYVQFLESLEPVPAESRKTRDRSPDSSCQDPSPSRKRCRVAVPGDIDLDVFRENPVCVCPICEEAFSYRNDFEVHLHNFHSDFYTLCQFGGLTWGGGG
jgi:hypothetical protein